MWFLCFWLRLYNLAWGWTWWTSQRLLDLPRGCHQPCLPSERRNCENGKKKTWKKSHKTVGKSCPCNSRPLLDPPQTCISKIIHLWSFTPHLRELSRKETLPFQEGEHTSIQRFPTVYLPDNKISKWTKGGQKGHQESIASLWLSYVHFSCTFLSSKFTHVFTETEKSRWKSLLWCLGLNPLFQRGFRQKISLTLPSFVSLDGFKQEHSKEDVLVIWKQHPACCRFFVSAVKALLGAEANSDWGENKGK